MNQGEGRERYPQPTLLFPRPLIRVSQFSNYTYRGKGKESDPTDASANASANALADCRPTVGRLSADSRPTVGQQSADALATFWTDSVQDASVMRRWCVGGVSVTRLGQGALVRHFVDNFQLCYTEEVSYRAACCACESVSIIQTTFLLM